MSCAVRTFRLIRICPAWCNWISLSITSLHFIVCNSLVLIFSRSRTNTCISQLGFRDRKKDIKLQIQYTLNVIKYVYTRICWAVMANNCFETIYLLKGPQPSVSSPLHLSNKPQSTNRKQNVENPTVNMILMRFPTCRPTTHANPWIVSCLFVWAQVCNY